MRDRRTACQTVRLGAPAPSVLHCKWVRKSSKWAVLVPLFAIFAGTFCSVHFLRAADGSGTSYSALSDTLLARAQDELTRVQTLVANGTLPQSRLREAQAHVDDLEDDAILARTLYGPGRVQDLTSTAASEMVAAAERRVNRQAAIVEQRQKLLEMGILAKSEVAAFQDELDSRKRVLELARNRAQLVSDLQEMAKREQQLEQAALAPLEAGALKYALIRYDGNGFFNLNDLTTISNEFERRFHRPLPVSALGQTAVHQAMGLDHRNRVDVALNPEQPEGIWLRQLLEHLHVPYLAFRSAVAGAATAPHIHIGLGSTRLRIASR